MDVKLTTIVKAVLADCPEVLLPVTNTEERSENICLYSTWSDSENAFGKNVNELIVPTETFNVTMRVYMPG